MKTFVDEYGVTYSEDKKILIKGNENLEEYTVPEGHRGYRQRFLGQDEQPQKYCIARWSYRDWGVGIFWVFRFDKFTNSIHRQGNRTLRIRVHNASYGGYSRRCYGSELGCL